MSLQVSACPDSLNNAKQDTNRRLANFHPSIWGDYFLSYATDSMENDDIAKLLELKEEVKRMLVSDVDKPEEKLEFVDSVQRLGVSYHFESEIRKILEKTHQAHQHSDTREDKDDLYSVSLEFRLLRQHGYNISSDVFNKFRENGNFKASLAGDIRGLLSLYEAAHLRVHGEDLLDEALAFATTHLEAAATQLNNILADQVKHALNRPLRKSLPRLEARYYISIYQQDLLHSEVLLTFAKLDFNMLQKQHQRELSDITRWWKSLEVPNKLPFARDRVVEAYFWTVGVFFEPEFGLARRIFAKVISMSSIIDDIYDAYGTMEELEPFTTAIEKWDINSIEQLPEYMKHCYKTLLDVYDEIEKDMASQGKLYRLDYAKEGMNNLARIYLIEAKWCDQNYTPTMEEYMSVGSLSCGYVMLSATSFVGMGDIVTKEGFEWIFGNPKILKAASTICRLMDDIVGHKFEQKRGHVASAVECYMKQYGASEDETIELFRERVANAWKDINEEFLMPTAAPVPLLERVLNLTRLMDVLYKHDDSYTNSHLMKDLVVALFQDPVLL